MVQALRSEFKKLLTVRSTYFLVLAVVLLSGFFTYMGTSREYVFEEQPPEVMTENSGQARQGSDEGPKVEEEPVFQEPETTNRLQPEKLRGNIATTVLGSSLFIAIAVLLLMAHEYRYNTINYALTLSNRRSKVLGAKLLTGAAYATTVTLLAVAATIAATYLAVAIKGLILPPQDIEWISVLGKALFYTVGFSLMGLAIMTLVRNLTVGIVSLFIVPAMDGLLSNILQQKYDLLTANYLPFSALGRVVESMQFAATGPGSDAARQQATVPRAAATYLVYLVLAWAAAWYLFLRRDAN